MVVEPIALLEVCCHLQQVCWMTALRFRLLSRIVLVGEVFRCYQKLHLRRLELHRYLLTKTERNDFLELDPELWKRKLASVFDLFAIAIVYKHQHNMI